MLTANKMIGRVYGRLTVVGLGPVGSQQVLCVCECGTKKLFQRGNLKRGVTRSCGCLRRDLLTSHGLYKIPEHAVWRQMLQRCENPKAQKYKDYGGRGIKICKRWRKFENFILDMGRRPSNKHSIERRNNDKGYSKSNCYWATKSQQNYNKRTNSRIPTPWGMLTKGEALKHATISRSVLDDRIRRGWPQNEWFIPCTPDRRSRENHRSAT